jgi:hypothetical protein
MKFHKESNGKKPIKIGFKLKKKRIKILGICPILTPLNLGNGMNNTKSVVIMHNENFIFKENIEKKIIEIG